MIDSVSSPPVTTKEIEAHMEEFWHAADATRMTSETAAHAWMVRLAHVPLPALRSVLVQYRYFTIYYITDLALLVARLPFGELRSLLADFLNDELGNGDPKAAHESIYDDFLSSLGVSNEDISRDPHQGNLALLGDCQQRVTHSPPAYALGLRGMGGECLCQVYLATMHDHFRKNPEVIALENDIDWAFWDIHTGDVDIAHREQLKDAIRTFVTQRPEHLPHLVQGYRDAKNIWDQFWSNIHSQYLGGVPLDMAPRVDRPTAAASVLA